MILYGLPCAVFCLSADDDDETPDRTRRPERKRQKKTVKSILLEDGDGDEHAGTGGRTAQGRTSSTSKPPRERRVRRSPRLAKAREEPEVITVEDDDDELFVLSAVVSVEQKGSSSSIHVSGPHALSLSLSLSLCIYLRAHQDGAPQWRESELARDSQYDGDDDSTTPFASQDTDTMTLIARNREAMDNLR